MQCDADVERLSEVCRDRQTVETVEQRNEKERENHVAHLLRARRRWRHSSARPSLSWPQLQQKKEEQQRSTMSQLCGRRRSCEQWSRCTDLYRLHLLV